MLIDRIYVQAFRGIRDSLEIHLSAPLTVIYAPNGTGKTTICDAVEWLLTGRVDRLGESQHGVRCQFTQEAPLVEADLRIGTQFIQLRRNLRGNSTRIEWRKDKAKPFRQISPSTLLEQITHLPVSAGMKGRHGNNARNAWIRASRLLTTSSLDLLVDYNKSTHSERSWMFSDLFGVEELQKQENDLVRLRRELPSQSQLQRNLNGLKQEIQRIEARIDAAAADESDQFRARALTQLTFAASALNQQIYQDQSPTRILDDLRAQHSQMLKHLEQAAHALVVVQSEWIRLPNLRREEAELRYRLDAMYVKQQELTEAISATRSEVAEHHRELNRATTAVQESKRLYQTLLETKDELRSLGVSESALPLSYKLNDLATLKGGYEHLLAVQSEFEDASVKLRRTDQQVPQWTRATQQLRELLRERDIVLANLPDPDRQSQLRNQINEISSQLQEERDQKASLMAPLERLRTEARNILRTLDCESACPLCLYDHGNADALQSAIEVALATIPAAGDSLARRIAFLEKELEQLQNEQKKCQRMERQFNDLTAQIDALEDTLVTADSLLEEYGLIPEDLGTGALEVLDRLSLFASERLDIANGAVALWREQLSRAGQVHILGQKLRGGVRAWLSEKELEIDYSEIFSDTPSHWVEEINALLKHVSTEIQSGQERIASARSAIGAAVDRIQSLEIQHNLLESERKEALDRATQVRQALGPILEAWHLLAGDSECSEEELQACRSRVESMRGVTSAVATHLQTAADLLIAANAAAEDRRAHSVLLEDLRSACRKHRECELLLARCAEIEVGIQKVQDQKQSYIRDQVAPLQEVITTLYLRAQANGFVDRINAEPRDGGALAWLAKAGAGEFDDMVHLSQGQRQDLALAIFLARARSLGGTFFLDEPLAHLDDLNRVALLDIFRALASEQLKQPMRLVVTTADYTLVRHLREKFSLLPSRESIPLLRIYALTGNPRFGTMWKAEPPPRQAV